MNFKEIAIILLIIFFSASVRFISLDQVPAGLYIDEASIGYNAYSILQTGRDEYGKALPVFFRSFATFQSPLYTYLDTIPVAIFGLNMFSTRFISALFGTVLVLITYLFIKQSQLKYKSQLALLSAFVVGLSPWAIFQSRVAVESNVALVTFVLSLYFFLLSLTKIKYFIPACIILAVSMYGYHGERLLSPIFLGVILLYFRRYFLEYKKLIIIGAATFLLICLPQLFLLTSPGSMNRFETQGFTQEEVFNKYGGNFKNFPIVGRYLYIANKFTAQYISSYSPRNLFFDPEPSLFRSMTNMSTFYFWMIIPFLLGIKEFWIKRSDKAMQIIILSIIFGSLPAAVTGDPFYTLRILPMLWGITILIAFGLFYLISKLRFRILQYGLSIFLIFVSCFMFYISYFIIFQKERSYVFGYPFLQLALQTEKMPNKQFILDSEPFGSPYILMAFFKNFDPTKIQQQTPISLLNNYYTDINMNKYRTINNIDVRPLDWGKDPCIDQIIVVDDGLFSELQINQHYLIPVSSINDLTQKTILQLYQTQPEKACRKDN